MELIITNKEEFDNRPILPLEIKNQWLKSLRSEKYNKGKHLLLYNDKYCCLGVLCEIQERPKNHINEFQFYFDGNAKCLVNENPLFSYLNRLGNFNGFKIKIRKTEYSILADVNDNSETFDEVIEIIEKYF
jgi:hypothetical protein